MISKDLRRLLFSIGIIVIVILLLRTCEGDWKGHVINSLGGYTAKDVKETIDTVSIRRDTIWAKPDTIRLEAKTIVVPKVVYKYKTPSTSPLTGNPETPAIDSVYVYNQAYSDTLINANIETVVNIKDSKIVAQSLEYTPKFPTIVKEYITIEKTKEVTLSNKPKNKVGLGINASSSNRIGGLGVFQTKRNWQYQVGYSWGSGNIIPSKEYIQQRQGEITVGVLKLF